MEFSPRPHQRSLPALVAALGALALAVLTFGAHAGPAAASSSVFDTASQMNLVFSAGSARLVGSDALVQVRCEGPRSGACNGTVVLRLGERASKVPFAVTGGARQSLAVTVGSGDALRGRRAVALARTAQPAGGYLRAREVLQLR